LIILQWLAFWDHPVHDIRVGRESSITIQGGLQQKVPTKYSVNRNPPTQQVFSQVQALKHCKLTAASKGTTDDAK